jgi:predicted dehydrogenase
MNHDRVRLAILGCGGFSASFVQPALDEVGAFDVVACFDPVADAARATAEHFGGRVFTSAAEAIAADNVEAVAVMGPNNVHREQTVAALEAGRHVYVEKPIANTAADGLAMVAAAEAADRMLMVGHCTRRMQGFRRVQTWLAEGRLGQPVSAEGQFSHAGGKHLSPEAWRADPDLCPGLPLTVIGVHMVDILNMLFGDPRHVAAMHRRAVVPTNDDVTATLVAYDAPVLATVISHYATPAVHELRIIGTDAVAEVHHCSTEVTFRPEKGDTERFKCEAGPVIAEEFAEFARAVRGGDPVETDGRTGVMAAAVIDASVRSAREGRFVDIDEVLRGA